MLMEVTGWYVMSDSCICELRRGESYILPVGHSFWMLDLDLKLLVNISI